jgi:hypothetical protein
LVRAGIAVHDGFVKGELIEGPARDALSAWLDEQVEAGATVSLAATRPSSPFWASPIAAQVEGAAFDLERLAVRRESGLPLEFFVAATASSVVAAKLTYRSGVRVKRFLGRWPRDAVRLARSETNEQWIELELRDRPMVLLEPILAADIEQLLELLDEGKGNRSTLGRA